MKQISINLIEKLKAIENYFKYFFFLKKYNNFFFKNSTLNRMKNKKPVGLEEQEKGI